MKSLIIFIIMFIPFQLNSQWVELIPIPDPIPGRNFSSVHFIDSLNGWISGDYGVLIHTTDGGRNWIHQESGVTSHLRKIRFSDLQNGWAVGDSGRIIHTTNGGDTWILQNSTDNLLLSMLSVVDSHHVWAAGRWGTSGQDILLYTSNGGTSWGTLNFRLDFTNEHVSEMVFIDQNKGWYCTWRYVSPFTGGAIYHTPDGGQSWIRQQAFTSIQSSISFTDGQHGWCIGDWALYATTNGGVNWAGRGNLSQHWFSDVYFVDSNIGWIVENIDMGSSSAIHFSSDGGYNWFHQFSTSTYKIVLDISFVEKRIGWIVVGNTVNPIGLVLHTTNGGGVFPSAPEVIYPIDNQQISTDTVNLIWKSAEPEITNYSINISTDSTFINYIDTLVTDTSLTLFELESNKNYYWSVRAQNDLGWGSYSTVGLFNTIITDVKNEFENQFNFSLYRNYPNPFNPTTSIEYRVGSSEYVTLKVYDVLGREVATLVNEENHPGVYEVEFDAAQLVSGIYYYQIRSGNFSETKKMILLR